MIVGRISIPDIGASHCVVGLIFGPLTIKGTLIPPSFKLHLPPWRGLLRFFLGFGFGGILGTAPLSAVKITYVLSDNPNSSKAIRTPPILLSSASVIAE